MVTESNFIRYIAAHFSSFLVSIILFVIEVCFYDWFAVGNSLITPAFMVPYLSMVFCEPSKLSY